MTQVRMRKLATYASFVRFSHSVFALPFALTGALLASRQTPMTLARLAWVRAGRGGPRGGARRGGLQPPGGRAPRRAQPAPPGARSAARGDDARRSARLRRPRVGR